MGSKKWILSSVSGWDIAFCMKQCLIRKFIVAHICCSIWTKGTLFFTAGSFTHGTNGWHRVELCFRTSYLCICVQSKTVTTRTTRSTVSWLLPEVWRKGQGNVAKQKQKMIKLVLPGDHLNDGGGRGKYCSAPELLTRMWVVWRPEVTWDTLIRPVNAKGRPATKLSQELDVRTNIKSSY